MNEKTIAELREYCEDGIKPLPCDCGATEKDIDYFQGVATACRVILEILSRAEVAKDEPLAVFAYHSGYRIEVDPPSINDGRWGVSVHHLVFKDSEVFYAPTYSEVEAKARAYLEGLVDVKNSGDTK